MPSVFRVSVPLYCPKRSMASHEEKHRKFVKKYCEDMKLLCRKRTSIRKETNEKKKLPFMCPKECPCQQEIVMKPLRPIPRPKKRYQPQDEPRVCPRPCTTTRADDDLKVTQKTPTKLEPKECPCVEKRKMTDTPSIKRLNMQMPDQPKPQCPPDPCALAVRADVNDWFYPNCDCEEIFKGCDIEPFCPQRRKYLKMLGKGKKYSTMAAINSDHYTTKQTKSSEDMFFSCDSNDSLSANFYGGANTSNKAHIRQNTRNFVRSFSTNTSSKTHTLQFDSYTSHRQCKRQLLKWSLMGTSYLTQKRASCKSENPKCECECQSDCECECEGDTEPECVQCQYPVQFEEKSRWRKFIDFFKARPCCPTAAELKQKELLATAVTAAEKAGLCLYDPNLYYPAKKPRKIRMSVNDDDNDPTKMPPCGTQFKKCCCELPPPPPPCEECCDFGPPPCAICTMNPVKRCSPKKKKKKKARKTFSCPSCARSFCTCAAFAAVEQKRGYASWKNPCEFYNLEEIDNYLFDLNKENIKDDSSCAKSADKGDVSFDNLYNKLFKRLEVLSVSYLNKREFQSYSRCSECDTLSNASLLDFDLVNGNEEKRQESILNALEDLYICFQGLSQGKLGTAEQIEAAKGAMMEIEGLLGKNLNNSCK